jgi:hypothetical protein
MEYCVVLTRSPFFLVLVDDPFCVCVKLNSVCVVHYWGFLLVCRWFFVVIEIDEQVTTESEKDVKFPLIHVFLNFHCDLNQPVLTLFWHGRRQENWAVKLGMHGWIPHAARSPKSGWSGFTGRVSYLAVTPLMTYLPHAASDDGRPPVRPCAKPPSQPNLGLAFLGPK